MITISLFIIMCLIIMGLAVCRYLWTRNNSNKRSRTGILGIKILVELIQLTQQHRGMHSGLLNGKIEFTEKLSIIEKRINSLYTELLNFEKTNNYPAQLSAHYQLKQWERLIKAENINSAESFKMHSGLISRQLDSLCDMSDEFALTSNKNLDIRNISLQFVKTLPEIAEALGQIRALSVQVASKQIMSSDKKLQLLFTLDKIQENLQHLTTPLPDKLTAQVTEFTEGIKQNIHKKELNEKNPDTLFKEATLAIDAIFTSIHLGFEGLSQKIQNSTTL